ncbi:MAG: hypothetical protein GF421_04755 [Candidatus Aminicenantes bacterium]|nr:hypothetical protein [Candidatus Aminicenantes bacterium]
MTKKTFLPVIIILLITSPSLSATQFYQQGFSVEQIRLGLDAEFFDRMITWDEDQSETSSLRSYLFSLSLGYEILEGTSVTAVLGYSLSNFDDMIFNKLPFSLELNTGHIDGIVFGGKALIEIINLADFTLSARGQFIYYLGFEEQWDIPGLNVEGTANGNPSWARLTAGPKISFHATPYLRPYVTVNYDRLWGKFKMTETIEELTGEQEIKIESQSYFNFSIGTLYEIIDRLDLKAEATLLPLEDQIGLGIAVGALYSF